MKPHTLTQELTAFGESHNFHDANYFTFHRLERFRDLTMVDAAPWIP